MFVTYAWWARGQLTYWQTCWNDVRCPTKMREFSLRHDVQRHFGQLEDWTFQYHWLRALAMFDITSFPAILSGIGRHFTFYRYVNWLQKEVNHRPLRPLGPQRSQIGRSDMTFVREKWREVTLNCNAKRHLDQYKNWIACVSLATRTRFVWRNMLSRICRSIGRYFKRSVDTFIFLSQMFSLCEVGSTADIVFF